MRAVIVASEWAEGRLVSGSRCPAPLLPLVDRPIVEHVCGILVGAGVTRVEWILRADTPEVIDFLGDGTKWGLKFHHHLVSDAPSGYALTGRLLATRSDGERLILGRADRFVDPFALRESGERAPVVLVGTGAEDCDWCWCGWARLSGGTRRVPPIRDEKHLEAHLNGFGEELERVWVPAARTLNTVEDYLEANQEVLRELVFSSSDATGRWVPGVRVAPSASVHPTATLIAPVFIGAGCEVAAGATVGPYVTVGKNCVIDRGAVVTDAVVLPGTYVAERAELESVIVEPDRIIVSGSDGATVATSGVPVGSLTDHCLARTSATLARWHRRTARFVAHLRGIGKSLRKSVSERLGAVDQPGTQPDALPIATTTD